MDTKESNRRIRSTTRLSSWHSVEGFYLRRILGWTGVAIVALIGVDLILTDRLAIGFVVTAIAAAGAVRLRTQAQPGDPS